MPKLFMGMSGGVDSSCAAFLSKEKGFDLVGVTHIVCDGTEDAAVGAKMLCDFLSVPHITQNLKDVFKKEVMEYFVSSYEKGETPNPCVMCNKSVKFPYLYSHAKEGELVGTGHYARIEKIGDRFLLKKGKDEKKDQSYVLWNLTCKQLSKTLFPLGEYTKEQIREIALENRLPSAQSKESQDICFIPDGDYVSFMKNFRGFVAGGGQYTDKDGNVLGSHRGHIHYTLGQTRGLGIALGRPMYVLSKDASTNTVVLGDREDVFKKTVKARDINLTAASSLEKGERLSVKIRYGKAAASALVTQTAEDELTAVFDEAVPSPAPGQSMVIYDGDTVIGGGIIK